MTKRNIIYLGIILVVIITASFYFKGENDGQERYNTKTSGDKIFTQTYNFSKEYINLRKKTDDVLLNASDFESYEAWNQQINKLISGWKQMEKDADLLAKSADAYIQENSVSKRFLINKAHAYTRQEISDVFDRAPAGKKIKTLAKFLGVDAKRAYKILKNDQEQVKADAWKEAGDTFRKLEVSATALKDGCKVAGFVGAVAISGGSAGFAGAGFVGQSAVLVGGADLALEVTGDGASIAFGDDNKISKWVADAKTITEPVASIFAIVNMPGNLATKFDKFGAFMFEADQLRSVIQDKKIIGIDISPSGQAHVSALDKNEVSDWIDRYKDSSGENDPWVDEMISEFMKEEQEKKSIESGENQEDKEVKKAEVETKQEDESDESHYGEIKVYSKNNSNMYVSIVSPKEASFEAGQARLWKASIIGYEPELMEQYECNWTFFINGEKYKNGFKSCAFTSGMVDKPGALRAELKVRFYKKYYSPEREEEIETIVVNRHYEVLSPPKDSYRH